MICMTDYNEFNWNEEEPAEAEPQNRPVYTESVLKPKSPKKKSGKSKLVAGVICGALAGSLISTAAVMGVSSLFSKNNSVTIYESKRIPEATATVTQVSSTIVDESAQILSIEEIAQSVGPAVVGISCTVSYQSIFGVQKGSSGGSGIIISDH